MQQPAGMHLAEVNVATALDDLDSPKLASFVRLLDKVNEVAERSPGFVWRLKDESGNATDIQVAGDPRLIVNLSVWETPADLEHFVWNTVHANVYRRKSDWFEVPEKAYFAMWWVPAGHRPTAEEAMAQLDRLNASGPDDTVFGWESLPNITRWKEERCA